MASGGLIEKLEAMGAVVRVSKTALTEEEDVFEFTVALKNAVRSLRRRA